MKPITLTKFPSRARGALSGARMAGVVLGVGAAAVVIFWLVRASSTKPPAGAASVASTNAALPGLLPAEFEKLKGRWERPDGGYVLEVRLVEPNGTVSAGYFNPRPIRVARAEAKPEGGTTKLYLELRDEGYPGSTYTLTYQPGRDELEGVYFQAGMGAYYDVVFVRMK